MNTHSKLREISFTRTEFYKPYEYMDGGSENMVLDNVVKKWTRRKDGTYGWIETRKVHPKSNSFWKLDFSERFTIWISVVSNNIDKVWLEDKDLKKPLGYSNSDEYPLKTIYTYETINKIKSKRQIIDLLPTFIKRDFIIRDLLK
jgi:hypothetical protein